MSFFYFLPLLPRSLGVSEFVLPLAPSNPIDAILFAKRCGCIRSFKLSRYRHVFCCAHVRIPNPIGYTISTVQLRVYTVFTKLRIFPLFYVTASSFRSCSHVIIWCPKILSNVSELLDTYFSRCLLYTKIRRNVCFS
jgi:hypothetical protein